MKNARNDSIGRGSDDLRNFGVLGENDLAWVAELIRRGTCDDLRLDDLRRSLLAGDPPAVLRGERGAGVVASVVRGGRGHIRLLVVDPHRRREGLGNALLAAAEADLKGTGAEEVLTGADAPDYLWPGVDVRETGLLAALERRGYWKHDANFNMEVDLSTLPPDEGGWIGAGETGAEELRAWLREHYPLWEEEALSALGRGTLVASRDASGLTGFAAWDVNRRGWFGPTGVSPQAQGRGLGRTLLLAALHEMRRSGLASADIAWVGPVGFYAGSVGARINRVFFVYRKRLSRS